MARIFTFLLVLFFGAAPAFAEPMLPTLNTKDLNGREVTLPAQLPGKKTVVFIAYWQEQQPAINKWAAAMGLTKSPSGQAWVELPVVGAGAKLFSKMIDNGMRSGIQSTDMRARTMTIYSSKRKFNRAMGISNTDQIYVAVIDRAGKVYEMVGGAVTPEKIAKIKGAL